MSVCRFCKEKSVKAIRKCPLCQAEKARLKEEAAAARIEKKRIARAKRELWESERDSVSNLDLKIVDVRARLHRYQWKSKSANMECDLQLIDVANLMSAETCHYCDGATDSSFHVDRKDSSLGYTLENTVAACPVCNVMKGNWLTEEQQLFLSKQFEEKYGTKLSSLS